MSYSEIFVFAFQRILSQIARAELNLPLSAEGDLKTAKSVILYSHDFA
jgi:hypothetical protein